MAVTDLFWVLEIERSSFPTPWSEASFRHELNDNPYASLFVARRARVPGVIGYACVWIVDDELRINNVAVHPKRRGKGIGTRLLVFLLDHAARRGCREATLEVRPSNEPARRLYEKAGFQAIGQRENYYMDTHEDAVVMSRAIDSGALPR